MKLSEKIQDKILRQQFVGHHTAAVIDYSIMSQWLTEAKELEQKLSIASEEGKESEKLIDELKEVYKQKNILEDFIQVQQRQIEGLKFELQEQKSINSMLANRIKS